MQFGNANNYGITVDVPGSVNFNNVTVNMFPGTLYSLSVAAGKTLTVNGTLTLTEGYLGAGTGTIDAKGALIIRPCMAYRTRASDRPRAFV